MRNDIKKEKSGSMNQIGIRHGRLLCDSKGEYDFFKSNFWKKEFEHASDIGFDCIELSLNNNLFDVHPFFTKDGRKELLNVSKFNGIKLDVISFDFLMVAPISESILIKNKTSIDKFNEILNFCCEVEIKSILIPLLGASSIKNSSDRKKCIDTINFLAQKLYEKELFITLETDLNANECDRFFSQISKDISFTYDLGNANYFGFNILNEIQLLKNLINNIHIKDSTQKNANVAIGTGEVKFEKIIAFLKQIKYDGPYTFETPYRNLTSETPEEHFKYIKRILLNYE